MQNLYTLTYARLARTLLSAAFALLLSGCAGNVLSLHSDIMLGLATKTRAEIPEKNPSCGDNRLRVLPPCQELAKWERFTNQIDRVNYNLSRAALVMYPDLKTRFPDIEKNGFETLIVDDETPGLNSSGMGRIAINAGVRHLQATDDWLAFAMAMEIGRIVAGQHERNAAMSIGVGVLATATGGASLLTTATGFLSSEALRVGAASSQDREALSHARALLEAAGVKDRQVLINMRVGYNRAMLGESAWSQRYLAIEHVVMAEADAADQAAALRGQSRAMRPVAE